MKSKAFLHNFLFARVPVLISRPSTDDTVSTPCLPVPLLRLHQFRTSGVRSYSSSGSPTNGRLDKYQTSISPYCKRLEHCKIKSAMSIPSSEGSSQPQKIDVHHHFIPSCYAQGKSNISHYHSHPFSGLYIMAQPISKARVTLPGGSCQNGPLSLPKSS